MHLRQLYGPSPVDYLAWHWRPFDADNPQEVPVKMSQLAATMDCAGKLAGEVGVDLNQRSVLLITDFNIFRQFVAEGQLRRVTTLNITARHIEHTEQQSAVLEAQHQQQQHAVQTTINIFVDLYLMSPARCLLTSRSGFSKLALWMAGGQLL
ncbi:hypothetical protein PLESTF_001955600 [Pleodorina starrii]|nr:hypothetical protein PLESTM_001073800 [Pleodorina starrii]GLC77562.1 hypothetical protein PLESTF_001955600 [Pleodorina starrii]